MRVSAQKRTPGNAPDLIKSGRLPGVVYNKETNIPVSLELREFDKAFRSQGTSNVINLDIDGERARRLGAGGADGQTPPATDPH